MKRTLLAVQKNVYSSVLRVYPSLLSFIILLSIKKKTYTHSFSSKHMNKLWEIYSIVMKGFVKNRDKEKKIVYKN